MKPHRAWLLILGVAGCQTHSNATMAPNISQASIAAQPQATPAKSQAQPERWPHFAEHMQWPTTRESFLSEHGSGRSYATVKAMPETEALYRAWSLGNEMPIGAEFLESLHPASGAPATEVLAMRKTLTGWLYARLSPQGELIEENRIHLCHRCHSAAPSDEIFGLAH